MKRKYLLLLTVCCSCLLAAFICSGCNNRDSSQKHTAVKKHTSAKETVKPYSDFKYTDHFNRSNLSLTDRSMDSIDIDTFKSTFNEFHTALDSDGNEERILSLYDQLCEQLNMLLTDATLAQYAYYLDTESQEKAECYHSKESAYTDSFEKTSSLFQRALSSQYSDVFRSYIGEDKASRIENSLIYSDEAIALKQQKKELIQRYEALITQGAKEQELKQLYIDLVNTNNAFAQSFGYANYPDFVYAVEYGRDYTMTDLKKIENEVKDNFIPVFHEYVSSVTEDDSIYVVYDENHDRGEEKIHRLRKCIQKVCPALEESLIHLQKNTLYDVEASSLKYPALSFSAPLPAYNDAYIYSSPYETVSDYSTLLHEFGHYNYYYHNPAHPFDSRDITDVSEIMSQGLELICYDYYDTYYPECGDALASFVIFDMMASVADGFTINEAEYRSYTTPDLDIKRLDQIWENVSDEYNNSISDDTSWTYIDHVFEEPFYYIGYATSALASFELFLESRVDFHSGVAKYMTLTTVPAGTKYQEALTIAGLNNIFEPGTIAKISEDLSKEFDLKK